MKAIAEYFRDLAADDRYFGAEPPVPDAAMLHKIAEREVNRRVEAQMQDGGVVLRMGDALGAADAVLPPPAPTVSSGAQAEAEGADAAQRLAALRAEIAEKTKAAAQLEEQAAPLPAEQLAEAAPQIVLPEEPPIDLSALHFEPEAQTAPQPAAPQPATLPAASAAEAAAQMESILGAGNDYIEDEHAEPRAESWDAAAREAPQAAIEQATANPPEPAPTVAAEPEAPSAPARDALAPEIPAAPPADVPAATDGPSPAAEGDATVRPMHPRTRIIRVRRIEGAATQAANPVANSTPAQPAAANPSVLSPAAEAALRAELAALDEDALRVTAASPEDALDRMLARTNLDMQGEEALRRQNELSHLKTAAAVTEAERAMGIAIEDTTALDAFRDDLDRAVSAPSANRVPPLVLISEQRINRTPAKGGKVIKPQPGMTNIFGGDQDDDEEPHSGGNIFTSVETFEDFADRLGAMEPAEVMEAAAIYTAHVQKEPMFRRRHLLRLMSTLPDVAPINREESLTVFKSLLDKGRLTEVEPGLFAVTDRSPMLEEAVREAI